MYQNSRLLFCDHIFNGYGSARKDFNKQLMKTRKDALMGFCLPQDFRFRSVHFCYTQLGHHFHYLEKCKVVKLNSTTQKFESFQFHESYDGNEVNLQSANACTWYMTNVLYFIHIAGFSAVSCTMVQIYLFSHQWTKMSQSSLRFKGDPE